MILGIVVSWVCRLSLCIPSVLFVVALGVMLVAMARGASRCLFGVGATVAMFAIGTFVEVVDRTDSLPEWSGRKGRFEAILLEVPRMRGVSTKSLAYVRRIGRDSVPGMRREGVVNIYFANCVDAENLQIGERLSFEGKLQPPRNAGNPAEFDVEFYYYVEGVTGSVYLPIGGWQSIGQTRLTPAMRALSLRERVIDIYKRLGFNDEALSVLSALTVGEKRDLSRDTKELYSNVGASHILALSGLHLGILYMIISFLFGLLAGSRRWVLLREGVLLILLWTFVAVAGFAPSVLRAAILFTLLSVGRCIYREASSMNILAFAAIAMLLYSPRLLFDAGFQLSFASVFSILVLVPYFQRLIRVERYGRVYDAFAGLFSVSVAAQLGTLPFVWYYFGRLPLYFLATNIIVVPAAFAVMLLALFMLLLPIPFVQALFAWLLQIIISTMNGSLRLLASLPGATFEMPHIGLLGAVVVALLLVTLFYALICRSRRVLVVALIALFSFIGYEVYDCLQRPDERYILFFNNSKCPMAQLVASRQHSYILSSRSSLDVEFDYVSEPFWRREGMAEPLWLCDDYSDATVTLLKGMADFSGRRIKVLADDCWRESEIMQPVDCLFLCRGFLGNIAELFTVYPASVVVMDATLYSRSRQRIERECAALGVRCIDLASVGAVKWLCNEPGIILEPMRGK